jgi:holo-[acyl-carrier protein] synthase
MASSLRVGTDLVTVSEVARSIDKFGPRYLRRVYTPLELGQSAGRPERLAARFAGKEAVLKLLRPAPHESIHPVDIEISLLLSGAPHVRLKRSARDLADGRRMGTTSAETLRRGTLSVSLSHDGDTAVAVAAAVFERRDDIDLALGEDEQQEATARVVLRAIERHSGTGVSGVIGDRRFDFEGDLESQGLTPEARTSILLSLEDELAIMIPDESFAEPVSARSITRLVHSLTRAMPREATRK